MKHKSKVLKTYGYMFDKLQLICLIGGTRPNLGATRPQLGRQIAVIVHSIYTNLEKLLWY